MNLILWKYPVLPALFFLCLFLVVLCRLLRKNAWIAGLLTGICISFLLLATLVCTLPLEELGLMLLLLLLAALVKGGGKA